MIRQAENKVKIEGILAETDLKYGSFERNGSTVETIGGTIKVLVDQEINGKSEHLEVPVYLFSTKYTKANKINPSYESIEKVMKEFVSIAAAGSAAQADKVRFTGEIRMNDFYSPQNGQLISQPRVHASFISKAVGDFHPKAEFTLEFMVSSMNRVVDSEGVEVDPPRLNVNIVVPQYTPENATALNVDAMTLCAISPSVIDGVENYWETGSCYKASGRLNFSSRTEEVVEEVDFGEAQKTVRTISVSELIITGGTQAPLDEEAAWTVDEIKEGMAARKVKLEASKNRSQTRKTPAPTSSKKGLDLGF